MKKLICNLLASFQSCEIQNPQAIKGGNNGAEEEADTNDIIGSDDIIDG